MHEKLTKLHSELIMKMVSYIKKAEDKRGDFKILKLFQVYINRTFILPATIKLHRSQLSFYVPLFVMFVCIYEKERKEGERERMYTIFFFKIWKVDILLRRKKNQLNSTREFPITPDFIKNQPFLAFFFFLHSEVQLFLILYLTANKYIPFVFNSLPSFISL